MKKSVLVMFVVFCSSAAFAEFMTPEQSHCATVTYFGELRSLQAKMNSLRDACQDSKTPDEESCYEYSEVQHERSQLEMAWELFMTSYTQKLRLLDGPTLLDSAMLIPDLSTVKRIAPACFQGAQ